MPPVSDFRRENVVSFLLPVILSSPFLFDLCTGKVSGAFAPQEQIALKGNGKSAYTGEEKA